MEVMNQIDHNIYMERRETTKITGVIDVVSFDAKDILLKTTEGTLYLKGNDFHMKELVLEKGEISFDGRVDQLCYTTKKGKKKGLERAFKLWS